MIKKILAAVVLCALMVTSVVLAVGDSSEPVQFVPLTGTERSHFGFELIEALYQGGNVVLSPVSVEVALSIPPMQPLHPIICCSIRNTSTV